MELSETFVRNLVDELSAMRQRVERLERIESHIAATAATANTVALRDGSGNLTAGTFTGALTGNVTGNVTGALTGNSSGTHTGAVVGTTVSASSTMTASTGILVPRSVNATPVFSLDVTSTGSSISLANNATTTPTGGTNNFGGILVINETATNGGLGVFNVGAINAAPVQGISIIHDSTSVFSTTSGTASKINVYLVSGVLTIENKRGVTITLVVVPLLRTRTSI